ncbi:MAG: CSLREA domain-containing protein [Wenzhouxiangellaceae bacterium]
MKFNCNRRNGYKSPRNCFGALSVSMALFAALAAAPALQAVEVTTTADENGSNPSACALREAVRSINEQTSVGGCAFTPGDTLVELGAGTFELSLNIGVIDRVPVRTTMTIRGEGPELTFIEPRTPFSDDLFFVNLSTAGDVEFEGMTMRSLRAIHGNFNNPIHYLADSGVALRLTNVVFRDNVMSGAALFVQGDSSGTVHLERVLFENNTNNRIFGDAGEGGGIVCKSSEEAAPTATLRDVTFRNNRVIMLNTSGGNGGGMFAEGCNIDLERVTFERNRAIGENADALGGGLFITDDANAIQARLSNVTFFGNRADLGGALHLDETDQGSINVELVNVTFAVNAAGQSGDHIFQQAGNASLRNVLFGPSPGNDCDAATILNFTLLGGNMDSDGSCGAELFAPVSGLVCALEQSPSAFTATVPLQPGSAAIDAGTNTGCPATDQRNIIRPIDGDNDNTATCDIGAHESQGTRLLSDGFETCQAI